MFHYIDQNILTLLIFTPLVGAALLLLIPSRWAPWLRRVALLVSGLTFLLSLHLVYHFASVSGMQFTRQVAWIPQLGISYTVGVDGFSLWLILLTTLLMPIAILFSTTSIREKEKGFYFCLLILQTAIIGSLCAIDVFLFYVFWEAMLIPMYFLIGIFGHGRKVYAALKFFLFTLMGSIVMLVAMIYLYYSAGQSFLLADWLRLHFPLGIQLWLLGAFVLAFAIKVPLFPLHTWLPDAHTEAPTAGSVILAGVLLKMGTYGLVRFAMPLFPEAMLVFRPYLSVLAVIGIVYGALMAWVQQDMKRLIAYSSISHLGFVVLGLLAMNAQAVMGASYQMLNHGISAAGLFLLVGMLYERTHTREIAAYGGIAKQVPLLTVSFILLTLSAVAMPGTNSFVGEFLILSGSFATMPYLTAIASLGIILGAVYMLGMIQRVFFGPLNVKLAPLKDLAWKEILCLVPLIMLIFWMGLKPNFFLSKMESSMQSLTARIDEAARVE